MSRLVLKGCGRCGGDLFPDGDANLRCLQCGREPNLQDLPQSPPVSAMLLGRVAVQNRICTTETAGALARGRSQHESSEGNRSHEDSLTKFRQMVSDVLRRRPCGVITDIDGTISAIAPSPDEAVVTPEVRSSLKRLVETLELVAVITGRPARQARRLVGIDGLVYIGNHGLEWLEDDTLAYHPDVAPHLPYLNLAHATLRRSLADLPGLLIEDKGVTLSVHYRQTLDRAAARAAILNAIRSSGCAEHLQVSEGKMVVELRPPVCANKGTALLQLAASYRLAGAIYMGDDLSDIDAFRAIRDWRKRPGRSSVAIGVLSADWSREIALEADITLQSQEDVANLLAWLAEEQLANAKKQR